MPLANSQALGTWNRLALPAVADAAAVIAVSAPPTAWLFSFQQTQHSTPIYPIESVKEVLPVQDSQ